MSHERTIDLPDIGPDPLDAILAGAASDEDRELAGLVEAVRSTYAAPSTPDRSPALRRFTEIGGRPASPATGRRRIAAVTAFAGTVAGKLALGGAVAVAALGGLHASDTVNVPFMPDVHDNSADDHTESPSTDTGAPESPVSDGPSVDRTATTGGAPSVVADQSPPDAEPTGPLANEPILEPTAPGVTTPAPAVPVPVPTVPVPDVTLPIPDVSVPDTP